LNTRRILFALLISVTLWCDRTIAASPLVASFNSDGLSQLAYNRTVLYDSDLHPGDNFRIVDCTLVTGNTSFHFQDDIRYSKSWNAPSRTLTCRFDWGTVATQYEVKPSALEMTITVTNTTSDTLVNGLTFFPLILRFPKMPAPFNAGEWRSPGQPAVLVADYGTGAAAWVVEDVSRSLHYGLLNDNNTPKQINFSAWVGTAPLPWGGHTDDFRVPIKPQSSDVYHCSVRFGPTDSAASALAPDVFSAYAAAFPYSVKWSDRRPIAMFIIAANGPKSNSAVNPRGWFNNPALNFLTDAGQDDFSKRLLAYARRSLPVLRAMKAQGMIAWDIEGEQYSTVSYIGDPRVAVQLAPELARNNAIDKFFEVYRLAGFKVGVTVRPQRLVFKGDLPIQQQEITDTDEAVRNLADKISYAREHWGCSIFYIDSTGPGDDPAIFVRVHQQFPDVLLIPENPNVGIYSACAPFGSARVNRVQTPDYVRQIYPDAFSVIDTTVEKTDPHLPELIEGVRHGDILMFSGAAVPSTLVQRAYRDAAK
jgi:hypothetical protein